MRIEAIRWISAEVPRAAGAAFIACSSIGYGARPAAPVAAVGRSDADFHRWPGAQSREIGYLHRKKASDSRRGRQPATLESAWPPVGGCRGRETHEQEIHRSALAAPECPASL